MNRDSDLLSNHINSKMKNQYIIAIFGAKTTKHWNRFPTITQNFEQKKIKKLIFKSIKK